MKKLILIATLLASSSSWGECISGDCVNGIGTFTWDNGNKYVGEWKDSKRHGQGTYTGADGRNSFIYIGEWKDGKKHGQGTMDTEVGGEYVGEWKDDDMHGKGTFTDNYSGKTKTGVWKNHSYLGTKAELDAKERTRKAKEEADRKAREAKVELDAKRKAREEARQKYDRIYNACLLDKSSDVDMQVSALRIAVEETCEAIAEDPSWYEENWKYN